jgi:indole-3-glycerol phosphate synthase
MLEKIVAAKRQEIIKTKEEYPLAAFLPQITQGNHVFIRAIAAAPWALIAECKLASPAKGKLCETYSVSELARIYETSGATALSVHTDQHFLGKLSDLAAVRAVSSLPILRKDFIIDPYQIYESRAQGADCILLIAAVLTDKELKNFLAVATELGLDALVEVHSKEELARVNQLPVQLVGINNRDLKTFQTHIKNTLKLFPDCEKERLVISESGVHTKADALLLQQAGVRGILVGEGLVTATDIARQTRSLALSSDS